jgi:hypothetical protein
MKRIVGAVSPLLWVILSVGLPACDEDRSMTVNIAVRATGETDLVGCDTNGQIVYKGTFNTSSRNWFTTVIAGPGSCSTTPAIAVSPSGRAHVVAVGPNGELTDYVADPGTSWVSTQIAGAGTAASSPAIAVRSSTGSIDVAVEGAKGELFLFAFSQSVFRIGGNLIPFLGAGSWSQTVIAGATTGQGPVGYTPAIVLRPTGEEDIVVTSPYNQLLYYINFAGRSDWLLNTIAPVGSAYSSPAIWVRPTGEADIVVEGPNNSLSYYFAWPGTPWTLTTIAANSTDSAPSIVVDSSGKATVAALKSRANQDDELVFCSAFPGTSWTCSDTDIVLKSSPELALHTNGEVDMVAFDGSPAVQFEWSGPAGSGLIALSEE